MARVRVSLSAAGEQRLPPPQVCAPSWDTQPNAGQGPGLGKVHALNSTGQQVTSTAMHTTSAPSSSSEEGVWG